MAYIHWRRRRPGFALLAALLGVTDGLKVLPSRIPTTNAPPTRALAPKLRPLRLLQSARLTRRRYDALQIEGTNRRPPTEYELNRGKAIDALNASYPNTGYMGFPLVLAVIGSAAMGATMIATILTACVLFAAAIVLIECALQTGSRRRDILRKTALALAKNPLLVAPALGALFMASGPSLPEILDSYLALLGGAASPCALVSLGLFLADNAGRNTSSSANNRVQAALVALKLVVQPAVTWVVAVPILALPSSVAYIAVLLAALPTGTGPFMLAEFYQREALLTSRVVLTTTVLSVATLSFYLAVAGSY